MTQDPAIAVLDRLASDPFRSDPREAQAIYAAIKAIRALQGLRPHHPRGVVGNSYATLVVGYEEMVAAQDAIGIENDLGRFDLEAAQDKHRAERVARYRGMTPDERAEKWGRK